ncbi:pur operon repressor [Natranaerofaba carboxydovora]|uniref:pur operon repressor n=1 Tax=Natranaerofaba carboxydovora TaxID=2742683 RepID=UPI001F149124|nr:pur operon repressor [Natranaerofaba carboxydovora]UMZ75266.1 Pur operon repressor [Natranaerofaba carboxydovora]
MEKEKAKRTDRIIYITHELLNNPGEMIPLSKFVNFFGAAKSTISEDIDIVRKNLEGYGHGTVKTIVGKSGGIKFVPFLSMENINETLEELKESLESKERVLPGGYVYIADIVTNPKLMNGLGKIMAGMFYEKSPDIILCIETKGIPLAVFTAHYMGASVVIARRESKVTEGSLVTINYLSGTSKRIQTMSLSKRTIEPGSKVLILDDFMKGGGTMKGLMDMAEEFNAHVVGKGVLMSTDEPSNKLVDDFLSLVVLEEIEADSTNVKVKINPKQLYSYKN